MRKLILLSAVLSVFTTGCFFRSRYPGPPPPMRQAPMTQKDAVRRGFAACEERGLECRVQEVHLTGNDIWKVKMRAFGGRQKGHVFLEFDRYTHQLLRYDAKVRPWRANRSPRWDYDRDWNDDYDGDEGPPGHGATPPGQGNGPGQPPHGVENPGQGNGPPGHGATPPGWDKDKKDKDKDKKDKDKKDKDDDEDDDGRPRKH